MEERQLILIFRGKGIRMKRLDVLLDKRVELVNRLIELKTWQMSNPQAKATEAIAELESQLNELQEKIERVRMDS